MTILGKSVGALVKANGSGTPAVVVDASSIDIPEQDFPFRIHNWSTSGDCVATRTFTFKCSVGHVFGLRKDEAESPWSVELSQIEVDIGASLTESPVGTVTPGVLDERNKTTFYSGTADMTKTNVVYVKIVCSSLIANEWDVTLEMKTVEDAKADQALSPPKMSYIDEVHDTGPLDHSGVAGPEATDSFSTTLYGAVDTYTINLNTEGHRYIVTAGYEGEFHVPIAYVTYESSKWKVRQLLRSDVFFGQGIQTTIKYIDSMVTDFNSSGGCGA